MWFVCRTYVRLCTVRKNRTTIVRTLRRRWLPGNAKNKTTKATTKKTFGGATTNNNSLSLSLSLSKGLSLCLFGTSQRLNRQRITTSKRDHTQTQTKKYTMTSLFAESNKKKNTDFQEVQDTVSRLAAHKGVTAVLILNANGDILTQSTNTTTTTSSSSSSSGMIGNPKLLKKTLDIASLYIQSIPKDNDTTSTTNNNKDDDDTNNPNQDISFVRIRSIQEEVLVALKNNYVLVVLQDPNVSSL